jgi:Uma2 family endonuclease
MAAANSVIFEDRVEIPLGLRSLAEFRHWVLSETFPQEGRIDYIDGRIEVDLSPEDLFCHGTLKTELVRALVTLVKEASSGYVFTDSTRVSCPSAQLSVEPDVVYLSKEAISQGRVHLVPKQSTESGRFVELEGAPDLVVEIISDSSARKDKIRLLQAYWAAGVNEYWLFDARKETMNFELYAREEASYVKVEPDNGGYRQSSVFAKRFRLERSRDETGVWTFDLQVQ